MWRNAELATTLAGAAQPFAIRAEKIVVLTRYAAASASGDSAAGVVVAVQYHGAASRWQVKLDAGEVWSALVTEGKIRGAGTGSARRVKLSWRAEAASDAPRHEPPGVSTFFYRRPYWYSLCSVPPRWWFGTVYSGLAVRVDGAELLRTTISPRRGCASQRCHLQAAGDQPANIDIVVRTLVMAITVTLACAVIALPHRHHGAYARGRMKAFFYVGVMLPMWTSYLVKVYAWRLLLAKEGIFPWLWAKLGLSGLLEAMLATPGIGGPSMSSSYLGMFFVFVYMWLPFMILPMAAALERVPGSLLQASADLGARPAQTFRNVVLPLAVPGIAAGSVFTFSLTLGDYIIPSVVGAPGYFIGMMVYVQQGTAGNIPLAAAFSVVPIVLIFVYLSIAKRFGAFDAL